MLLDPQLQRHTGRQREGGYGESVGIEQVRRGLAGGFPRPPSDEAWIGNDAAVLDESRGSLLLAPDLTAAGVHADLDLMGQSHSRGIMSRCRLRICATGATNRTDPAPSC